MTETGALDRVLKALAHPARRRIFELVAQGETSVKEFASKTGVSQPAASQFLATLLDARLVEKRKIGSRVFYRVSADPLAPLTEWAAAKLGSRVPAHLTPASRARG
jgi:DNA-binding transcriptional ArsR family regulator